MSVCPFDLKPCIDDFCYGSGCMRWIGEPMIKTCAQCGGHYDGDYVGPVSNLCPDCNGDEGFDDDD